MEVRITFRSEIYIKGKNLEEIRDKWIDVQLFSEEALKMDADYVELVSAEDADTYDDYSDKL